MRKIILASEYFPDSAAGELTGGAESRCYNIALNLAKKYDVTILTSYRKGLNRTEEILNLHVKRIGPHHEYTHGGSFISRLGFATSLFYHILRGDAKLVDSQSFLCYLPSVIGSIISRKKRIATYHETWIGEWISNKGIITGILGSIWERTSLLLGWHRLIAVSKFTKLRLVERGVKPTKINVVHNGIDYNSFRKYQNQEKYDHPTICCVARLTEKKRVIDLVDAMKIVKGKIVDAKCIIIGKGEKTDEITERISEHMLEENIELKGFVPNYSDVVEMLSKSHIHCLPSILEGFGIAVIEAMAVGVPSVLTDIDPFKEVTQEGKGCLFVNQKNPKELAEAILKLLDNEKLYTEKVKEAKELAPKYDWPKKAQEVIKIYEEVLLS